MVTISVAWSIRNTSWIDVRPTPNWTPCASSTGRRAPRRSCSETNCFRQSVGAFAGRDGAAYRGELTHHRPLAISPPLVTCWFDVWSS